jgi:uncharacterized protein YuzE
MVSDIIASNSGRGPKPRMPATLNFESIRLKYDTEGDILSLVFGPDRPGTTIDNPNGVWWRIDSETGEIYGVEIQVFEHHFLTDFTDDARIAQHWHALKDQNLQDDESRVHFVGHILKLVGLIDGHATLISSTSSPRR